MIATCSRLCVLGLVLGAHAAHGQAVSFVRHLSGTQLQESAVSVARDVTGTYVLTSASVRKVDPTGAVIWTRPAGIGRTIVANGSGIYLVGLTRDAQSGGPASGPLDVYVRR